MNQTHREIEIILIDDGSADKSPLICDAWSERDKRIRVFHKENEGQGLARNVGIDNACGEYIYFVDSDDYIAIDTIEKAYSLAIKENVEIVVFGFQNVNVKGEAWSHFIPAAVPAFRGKAVQEEFLPDLIAVDPKGNGARKYYLSACMTLFSMELIQRTNWRFVSERIIISEENYSLPEILCYAKSVAVLPEPLYFYCENTASFSRKYMPGRYKKIVHFYESCLDLCDRLGYGEIIKQRFSRPYIDFTIAAMKQVVGSNQKPRKKVQEILEIIRDPVLQQVLKENKNICLNWKQKALFRTIRKNKLLLCYTFLLAQNVLDRR